MKKSSLFLSIALLLSLNACSQSALLGKKVQKEYIDPVTRKVQNEYFLSGNIHSEFIMNDNTGQNGIRKEYGNDGRVLTMIHIRNGLPHGLTTRYYINGRVLSKVHYSNGKRDGLSEVYYQNGDLMESYTYENGIKDGPAQTYNKDGSIIRSVIYKNDKIVN